MTEKFYNIGIEYFINESNGIVVWVYEPQKRNKWMPMFFHKQSSLFWGTWQ